MMLKISGRVFATTNEVIEDIIIDFNQDVELSIRHNDLFIDVTVGEKQWYFEKESIKYELY